MKRKEGRWTATNTRLRDKIDHVEQENEELKEEIKLLEKKRLEWMQKDQKVHVRFFYAPLRRRGFILFC